MPDATPFDFTAAGHRMHALMARLQPIPRSQAGPHVRQTLDLLGQHIALERTEVPTGTPVFDWPVPQEWTLRSATLKTEAGETLADAAHCPLHVVNFSSPVDTTLTWAELRPKVNTLPDKPAWTPYRTMFFEEGWGLCLPYNLVKKLDENPQQKLRVTIDTSRTDGSLTLAEHLIPGETKDEILLSAHTCHPWLCNDGLSGMAIASELLPWLATARRRHTVRLVLAPATIGPITWLATHQDVLPRIKHGLVLNLLGDGGRFHYKRSRRGDAPIDKAAHAVLQVRGQPFTLMDFEPVGCVERQFCSPGIDLPMGCLHRSPYDTFPQYHTSADDLSFVRPEHLAESLRVAMAMIDAVDRDGYYLNTQPYCEPRLGPRGLYQAFGRSTTNKGELQKAVLWVLNYSDGLHSLIDIAVKSKLPFSLIREAADALTACELLRELGVNEAMRRSVRPLS